MRVDRRLNLVIPVERADGSTLYVHAMPIGQEAFERHYMVIAKTWTTIMAQGLNVIAGPRVAAHVLREVAQGIVRGRDPESGAEVTAWDEPGGVRDGLVNEMRRLANVAVSTGEGWRTMPLADALRQELIDPEDAREVDNAQTFFTVVSAMLNRREALGLLEGAASLWGARLSSLNCTAYAASLPTSTGTDSSGERATRSSIPA